MQENTKLATFEIDGQKYQVGYNANSLIDAEEATGCNLLAAMSKLGMNDGSLTAKELRALLMGSIVPWDGYPKGKPAEELKACGELMRPDMTSRLKMALLEAMMAAISEEKRQELLDTIKDEEAPVPTEATPAPPQAVAA